MAPDISGVSARIPREEILVLGFGVECGGGGGRTAGPVGALVVGPIEDARAAREVGAALPTGSGVAGGDGARVARIGAVHGVVLLSLGGDVCELIGAPIGARG